MNLLMTLDRNYVPQLNVMLFSALHSDSAAHFDVYLLHDEGLSEEDVAGTRVLLGQRGELHLIRVILVSMPSRRFSTSRTASSVGIGTTSIDSIIFRLKSVSSVTMLSLIYEA